jgi:hypothetical protein
MRKLKFDLNVEPNALLCPNPEEFYSRVYVTEDIVNNFRTLPGIKSATKLANVVFDNLLKASTCNFTAPNVDLDAIDIDVCPLSAMAQICRFDIEQSFLSKQMAKGSNGSYEVASFMSYYWDEMAKTIHEEVATLRWQGDTGITASTYLNLCDGYEVKFAADSDIIDITATSSVTPANVLGEMTTVLQALPAKMQHKKGNLRFYVASDIATAFQIAAATGNTQAYITESLPLTFLGIQVVVQEGMSNGKMVLTNKDNLIYAFDAEGDATALKAVNLEDSVAEPLLRTRANLKVGFHYVNPQEIVYYA